jgi:hypothetical protein
MEIHSKMYNYVLCIMQYVDFVRAERTLLVQLTFQNFHVKNPSAIMEDELRLFSYRHPGISKQLFQIMNSSLTHGSTFHDFLLRFDPAGRFRIV